MAEVARCEKDLLSQNRELERAYQWQTNHRERAKEMESRIEHLEHLIETREHELDDKEKQIHLLTQMLTEHQSTLDQSLAIAEVRNVDDC